MKASAGFLQRISVSNIAWPAAVDAEAVDQVVRVGFAGIELAPSKVFSGWGALLLERAPAYRDQLAEKGLTIPALQAILFGVQGCELFVSDTTRANLARHLEGVARLAGVLGAHACVYGAPTSRDPGDLPPEAALEIAVRFFAGLAPAFEAEGSCLAFEANPPRYGCRFVTRTTRAIELVRRIDRPGIRVQLDTGTIAINGEGIDVVAQAVPYAAHFHASEPELAAVGSTGIVDHRSTGAALKTAGYQGWRSVEMRAVQDWRGALGRAAAVMAEAYA